MSSGKLRITHISRKRICPSQQFLILRLCEGGRDAVDQRGFILEVIYSEDFLADDPELAESCEGVSDIARQRVSRPCEARDIDGTVGVAWYREYWRESHRLLWRKTCPKTNITQLRVVPSRVGYSLSYLKQEYVPHAT